VNLIDPAQNLRELNATTIGRHRDDLPMIVKAIRKGGATL
jgi:hypothetical protein